MAEHYRITVLGHQGVGKSSITARCCNSDFSPAYNPTFEDTHNTCFTIDGSPCSVEILDTGCSEHFESARNKWIEGSGGFIVVYDISRLSSLYYIQQLLRVVHQKYLIAPAIPIALVGNKTDKLVAREVPEVEGRQMAHEYGALFLETSARGDSMVVFKNLVIRLLKEMRAVREVTPILKQPQAYSTQSTLGAWYHNTSNKRAALVENEKDLEIGDSRELDHREVSWLRPCWYPISFWTCGIWVE